MGVRGRGRRRVGGLGIKRVAEDRTKQVRDVLHPRHRGREHHARAEIVELEASAVRHPFGVDDVLVLAEVLDAQGVACVALSCACTSSSIITVRLLSTRRRPVEGFYIRPFPRPFLIHVITL